MPWFASYQTN
uniref:Uncharacterized protein n=1 Tax=Rhizophora mucronata TaxID=61149 RepID=A0A2P2PH74_RHIMU